MPLRTLPLLALAACALRPADDFQASATEATSTSAAATSTGPITPTSEPATGITASPPLPTTTEIEPSTGPSTTGPGDTTSPFIVPPDAGDWLECDQWLEDCPAGEKCMPYASEESVFWDSTKCVPVAPNPDGVGEPCEPIGSWIGGEDTCAEHSMCWTEDFDALAGTCVAFCDGSPDAPTCAPPATLCTVSGSGVLSLCLPMCDPLVQNCSNGDLCIPDPNGSGGFICVLDASGEEGQAFDPCEYANACDPGLYCVLPELATECAPELLGCCLPFCDLAAANTCPGQDQVCLPWLEEGQAQPGFEDVGICGLPMP
ncbi:ribulose phosphate epimerase [Nannocystis punicea]|uniref:Ribulose phosphate epimerase n=1 Tax=Nannocystis punicea TaxID=2995304 RepID=A0ABY7H6Q2_9BACT|nr:ribulose phosphate epimerase [Nannocystis poenicansa]WAS94775.1 ribulose phosphate epimerase [Nannocystis poenicansa]